MIELVLGCITVLTALYLYFVVPWKKYGSKQPVMIGQFWPPLLGVAKEFNIDPIGLFNSCREKHGDVYTLNIARRLFTVLHDPKDFDLFFVNYKAKQNAVSQDSSEVISFDEAVQEFTSRVFGLPVPEFMENHTTLIHTFRTNLSPNTDLPTYTQHMDRYMSDCLDQDWGASGTANMFDKVVETLFWTSTKALFGERILSHKNSYKTFKELDANFEMAASGVFPEFMLGKFGESKAFLLGLLKAGKGDETVLSLYERVSEALLDRKEKSDPSLHHHWGLAALWASQANSLPSTFWTLMYVLTNPEIEKKVREEVDAVTEVYSKEQTMDENLNQFKYIRNCITEAIRIQSPGMIVRKVMRPMRLNSNKNVIVPSGHTLVISPYAIHRDPKVYDEPDKFIPERWEGKQNHIFVPFGKGAHECPGKAFSMSEMTLFIALLFKKYPTLKIEQPFVWPKADMKRLIGVAHPTTPVTLRFSKN